MKEYKIEITLTEEERKKLLNLLLATPTFLKLAKKMHQGTIQLAPKEEYFTEEEFFEIILKFAHRAVMYDLEHDDFAQFGEGLWEKLSVQTVVKWVNKFQINIDALKIEQEMISEYENDMEE